MNNNRLLQITCSLKKFLKILKLYLFRFLIYILLLANDSNSELYPHESRIFASFTTYPRPKTYVAKMYGQLSELLGQSSYMWLQCVVCRSRSAIPVIFYNLSSGKTGPAAGVWLSVCAGSCVCRIAITSQHARIRGEH